MNTINPKNERIKRDYFRFQTQAKQKSQATLAGIKKAIHRFEVYQNFKDFITFNKEQAIAFKKNLSQQKAIRTAEPLSKSTALSTLNALKEFFIWLAWQPGYKSKIHVPDIEYFNLTEKEESIARSSQLKDFPTIEQIRKVIFSMPTETVVQRRDRALIAFTILTGMRDAAIASIRIKHIDLNKDPILVSQNPDQVNTKFSKQMFTHFFPVGDDIKNIFIEWMRELKQDLLFSQNDPVFPKTTLVQDENHTFKANGVESYCWSNASPIRYIFKAAFENCGLPYFSPHRFRNTLVQIGQQNCKTPEEFKAWSQSLGHESTMTTFNSYGYIDTYKQGEVIKKIGLKNDQENMEEMIRELYEMNIKNKKA